MCTYMVNILCEQQIDGQRLYNVYSAFGKIKFFEAAIPSRL